MVVLRYAFFLRYPLMMGCALVALPLSVLGSAAPYVKNLFVLEPLSLVLVGWMSVLAAWAVMYTLGLLYLNSSSRVDLPLKGATNEKRSNVLPKCLARPSSRLFWFGALSAPTLVTAAILSPGSTLVNLILGGIGILMCGAAALARQSPGRAPCKAFFEAFRGRSQEKRDENARSPVWAGPA